MKTFRKMLNNYELYLFILPALIYVIVYHYWPMYGAQIAFKDFRIGKGVSGSQWVGLKHFIRLFSTPSFFKLLKNTLSISIYSLVVGFPLPIIFALILNELKVGRFRKLVQMTSYAPHFISTVVLVSMVTLFLHKKTGIVNTLLGVIGSGPYDFMVQANWFSSIYVFSGIWQNIGWSSIIYLSALAGINPELHEAAMIDGASRLRRIWHINLAGIMPTITILLILAVGRVMSVGFEKVYLMQNPLNTEKSEIISTFVYKIGIQYSQYSFSSAVGLFNSVVNFILLFSVNIFTKKIGGTSLW